MPKTALAFARGQVPRERQLLVAGLEVRNRSFVEAKLEQPALDVGQLWRSLTGGYGSIAGPGVKRERSSVGSLPPTCPPRRPAGSSHAPTDRRRGQVSAPHRAQDSGAPACKSARMLRRTEKDRLAAGPKGESPSSLNGAHPTFGRSGSTHHADKK